MGGFQWVATLDQASLSYVTGICDFAVYDASGGAANGLTAGYLHPVTAFQSSASLVIEGI